MSHKDLFSISFNPKKSISETMEFYHSYGYKSNRLHKYYYNNISLSCSLIHNMFNSHVILKKI